MGPKDFYEKMTPESRVKVQIVAKYFDIWSKMISSDPRCGAIGYLDFFAGAGSYKDGNPSTPIRVLKSAAKHPRVAGLLRSYLNDGDPRNVNALRLAIAKEQSLGALRFPPQVSCSEVGDSIIQEIGHFRDIPTLSFVDPYGYKGVTAKLLKATMWGRSECILFFNFNRFNHALSNEAVIEHARRFFGDDADLNIKNILSQTKPELREQAVVTAVSETLKNAGATHLIFFRFEQEGSSRTSHYLVFATKHETGLAKMKEVMASESSQLEGITVFGWMPNITLQLTLGLFGEDARATMKKLMFDEFSGRTAKFEDVYKSVGLLSPYAAKDFKRVINDLELEGKVAIDKDRKARTIKGKLTLGDQRLVTFGEAT